MRYSVFIALQRMIMSSAVILRKRTVTKRQSISVWQRSPLPRITGSSEEVAWATQIRRVTLGKLVGLAAQMAEYYTLAKGKGALQAALEDVIHEVAAAQTEASWWINNRLRVKNCQSPQSSHMGMATSSDYYNMVGLEPFWALMPDYTNVFNQVTLAYGMNEYGAASTETTAQPAQKRIETAVIQGVTCARVAGSAGWISLE